MAEDILDQAKGRWHGILPALGVAATHLTGRQGPCPICGGKDRFRFDNKDGRGTWYCNVCGAGHGISLLMKAKGSTFGDACRMVRGLIGEVEPVKDRAPMTSADHRRIRRQLWKTSDWWKVGDPVDSYLKSRGITYTGLAGKYLRTIPARHPDPPIMLAPVYDVAGKVRSLHRTWLPNGRRGERKAVPGPMPQGGAIRLSHVAETLGIAEGIETALSAWQLFGVPTWSALNAYMLENWLPPSGCRQVIVFGDNDPNFAGQAAAYKVAHRLAVGQWSASVMIPADCGDWNDVLRGKIANA